jgi:hypothetical protein
MACPHCGSWSVKADRSLAGRLVCGRCGRALGQAASRRAGRRPSGRFLSPSGRAVKVPWWGWLCLLLLVSAGLASLERPASFRNPEPPSASGSLSWH